MIMNREHNIRRAGEGWLGSQTRKGQLEALGRSFLKRCPSRQDFTDNVRVLWLNAEGIKTLHRGQTWDRFW